MIELQISDEILTEAKSRATKLGKLNNSITEGAGNIAGYIGQLLVAEYLNAEEPDDYNFDVKKDNTTYEVKTKRCTSRPRKEYDCSVSDFNTKQNCDYYLFVRVLEDFSKAWILGKKKKADYFNEARFCEKGKVDEKSTLGWKFKADCYNLSISELESL
jgi:hypothetical protein